MKKEQKNYVVSADVKVMPEEVFNNLFQPEKKNIHVIVYCGYEGIDELVFATVDGEEAKQKIKELRLAADNRAVEAAKYTDDEQEEMLESEDPEVRREYHRIFSGQKDSDRYCVMTYDGTSFECTCNELDVPPKEAWLY
jgi:hypothetical protein